MISKELLHFFTEIEQNNNKPWFKKNKQRYPGIQNDSAFHKIINKKSFVNLFGTLNGDPLFDKMTRDKLIRPPKGYTEDNSNIELLKLKHYIIHRQFDDDMVCSKSFIKEVVISYKEALPFLNFFDSVKGE